MGRKKKGNIGEKISEPLYRKQCMYSVVQLRDKNEKLFECIPDIWFVDDEIKGSCYWPPSKGRSYTLRAMQKEIPDDSWDICECTVVSEGHATYSLGYSVVREKCAQFYNTSSADEHLQAANFRRKHPGLVFENETSIEKIFAASNATKYKEANKENEKSNAQQQKIVQGKSANATDSGNVGVQHQKSGQLKSVEKTGSDKSVVQQKKNVKVNSVHPTDNEKIVVPTDAFSSRSCQSRSRRRTRSRSKSDNSSSPSIISQSLSIVDGQRSTGSKSHRLSDSHLVSVNSDSESHVISSHIRRLSPSHTRPSSRRITRSRSISLIHSTFGSEKDSSVVSSANSPSSICSRKSSSLSSGSSSSPRSSSKSQSSACSERTTSSTRQRLNPNVRQKTASGKRQRTPSIHSKYSKKSSGSCSLVDRQQRQLTHSSKPRKPSESSGSQSQNQLNEQSTYDSPRSSTSLLSPQHQLESSDKSNQNVSTNSLSCSSNLLLRTLIKDVNELTHIANKNSRRIDENDRRIARMEITVNKTFIMIQDMAHSSNIRMSIGNTNEKVTIPRGFKIPKLPIKHVSELTILSTDLKNKGFYSFLVDHEKEFCFPTASTDNVILTAYLKRFISLKVRCKIALKDLKDVMKAGYRLGNKMLYSDQAK